MYSDGLISKNETTLLRIDGNDRVYFQFFHSSKNIKQTFTIFFITLPGGIMNILYQKSSLFSWSSIKNLSGGK